MGNDNDKQIPPPGAPGVNLSAEFAKQERRSELQQVGIGLATAGGVVAAVALFPEDIPAIAGGLGVMGAGAGAAYLAAPANEGEKALVAKMDSYSSQIQAHYLSIHPDQPAPQTLDQFVSALQDKQIFAAVRSAAGKDADPSVVTALDNFSKLEQERLGTTQPNQTPASAPAPKMPGK